MVLEAEEEVTCFVKTLKRWPLARLKAEGRVLMGMYGNPGGRWGSRHCLR